MTKTCTQCGNEYQIIASHWSRSSDCSYPTFTSHQKEIITGLLMGDGSISLKKRKNPIIECWMVSKEYLQYIDDMFGRFGKGVNLVRTAEENAKSVRERGLYDEADAADYQDMYRWRSMSHPELQEFSNWYSTGEKVWPEDIELTPTVLKHWYCGDGTCNNSGTHSDVRIAMLNEVDNTKKVSKLFENAGLSSPSNYAISEEHNRCEAQFTVDQSKQLWEYMGKPLPDFDYKWPEKYR